MAVRDAILDKLSEALAPTSIEVVDESHRHAGHAGHRPGGETHFKVHIVSAAFAGKSRVERHRMVTGLLAAELKEGVHALQLSARAPGEE